MIFSTADDGSCSRGAVKTALGVRWIDFDRLVERGELEAVLGREGEMRIAGESVDRLVARWHAQGGRHWRHYLRIARCRTQETRQ